MNDAQAMNAIGRPGLQGLGFLTHVSGDGHALDMLENALRLIELAERLGFDSAWVAQHHVNAEKGWLPSPLVFLAAAAQRTSRIRLGTAVVMLPLENPTRLAEDAAVADLLSGGRLELGVGPGSDRRSFQAFGENFDHRRAWHDERLADLLQRLDGASINGSGPVQPQAPGLKNRIWRGTASEDGARAAGAAGHALMLARSAPLSELPVGDVQLPLVETYLASFQPVARAAPRVATTRTIYPSRSHADAMAAMEMGTRDWARRKLRDHAWSGMPVEEVFARHDIHTGTPEQIVRALGGDRTLARSTDLLVQMQPGTPDYAATARALATIAMEIAPRLGWQAGLKSEGANGVSRNGAAVDGRPANPMILA